MTVINLVFSTFYSPLELTLLPAFSSRFQWGLCCSIYSFLCSVFVDHCLSFCPLCYLSFFNNRALDTHLVSSVTVLLHRKYQERKHNSHNNINKRQRIPNGGNQKRTIQRKTGNIGYIRRRKTQHNMFWTDSTMRKPSKAFQCQLAY